MIEVTHEGATIRVDCVNAVHLDGKVHNIHGEGGIELLRWMELRRWPDTKRIAVLEAVKNPTMEAR